LLIAFQIYNIILLKKINKKLKIKLQLKLYTYILTKNYDNSLSDYLLWFSGNFLDDLVEFFKREWKKIEILRERERERKRECDERGSV